MNHSVGKIKNTTGLSISSLHVDLSFVNAPIKEEIRKKKFLGFEKWEIWRVVLSFQREWNLSYKRGQIRKGFINRMFGSFLSSGRRATNTTNIFTEHYSS